MAVLLQRADDPSTDVLVPEFGAWGLSDGNRFGSASAWGNGAPSGYLGLLGFTTDGRTAGVDANLFTYTSLGTQTRLSVQLRYRPTISPDVYAIDVHVQRRTAATGTGGTLFEMSTGFDVPPDRGGNQTITWGASSGQAPAHVTYFGCNLDDGDPRTGPTTSVGLGTACAPGGLGTTVRLNLGALAIDERASFTLYVGVTRTSAAAHAALEDIDPALYALAEPTNPGGAVGIFAFSDLTHTTSTSAGNPT
ncbi:hypothetical protein [Cellulomonas soli]|uniref:hypothetical protein n=1 Tax=Cellulomonas soli TaxID=931535 RepID=UPI003F839ABF